MLIELSFFTVLVLLTVIFHGVGLSLLSHFLNLETRKQRHKHPDPLSMRGIAFTLVIVLGLFIIHGIEIWFYGFAYLLLDAIPDLRTAIYFSSITYAIIGYDHAAIADEWALIAAIEGINGILLLGWSTGFFMTVVTKLGLGAPRHNHEL